MQTYTFETEKFPSLLMSEDFLPGYQAISFEEFDYAEAEGLSTLLGEMEAPVTNDGQIDISSVMLIKVDNDGLVERIYPPSIRKNPDGGLCLVVGSNWFEVTQEPGEIKVGGWFGIINSPEEKKRADETTYMVCT